MNDTWRFIVFIALLVAVGSLLPLAADARTFDGHDGAHVAIYVS